MQHRRTVVRRRLPVRGEPEHWAALKSLINMGVVVFPLCGDITRFTQQIPKELQPIGGTQWDEARVTATSCRFTEQ